MNELIERELYQALAYAKSIDEDTGRKLIAQFQQEQPGLAHTLFGIFPAVIAEQDQDMANLFMDLIFDVLCVFQNAFGPLPAQNEIDGNWLEKHSVLLDAELHALMTNKDMDAKVRNKLQARFLQRTYEDSPQRGLVDFMNAAIDEFASEIHPPIEAIQTTKTLISVIIRLFGNLYNQTSKQ